MPEFNNPNDALRYHVSGAIERGEKEAIVEQPAKDAIVITGEDNIKMAAIFIPLRSALKLEIRTGMKFSNRGSTVATVNKWTGKNCKTKRQAYDAINDFIVEKGGLDEPRSEWEN